MKNHNHEKIDSDIKSAIHCLENNIPVSRHLHYLIGDDFPLQSGLLSEDNKRGAIARLIDGFKINWKFQIGKKINELIKMNTSVDLLINNTKNLELTENIEIDEYTKLIWTTLYIQGKVCNFATYQEVLKTISDCNFNWEPLYKAFTNANIKHKEAETNNKEYDKIIDSAKKDLENDISKIKNNNFLNKNILSGMDKYRNKFQESLFILKEDIQWIIPIFISHDQMLYIDNYDEAGFNISVESEIYIYPEDMNIKQSVVKLNKKEIEQLRLNFISACEKYKKHLQDAERNLRNLFNSKEVLDAISDKEYTSSDINNILRWYIRFIEFPMATLVSFYHEILKSYEE